MIDTLLRAVTGRRFLDPGWPRFGVKVVAAVGDSPALFGAVVCEHGPGLVNTDVRTPPDYTDERLRAADSLRTENPGPAVVALSQHAQYRQRGRRRDPLPDRGRCRQTHRQRPHQAEPPGQRRHQPAGPHRTRVPAQPIQLGWEFPV